jgi:hypothetical protein
VLPRFPVERAGLESSEADSAAVTLTRCLRSAGNLKVHLQCLKPDGVCERGAAGPGQYEAVLPAVPKLKTPPLRGRVPRPGLGHHRSLAPAALAGHSAAQSMHRPSALTGYIALHETGGALQHLPVVRH